MTTSGPEIGPPPTARVLQVLLIADGVAPLRLVYGGLGLAPDEDGDDGYAALTVSQSAGDWVFTVGDSPWLAERHQYEMERYSTSLLDTHQHYAFWFHDQFAEVIAEGTWLDIADPTRPGPGMPTSKAWPSAGAQWAADTRRPIIKPIHTRQKRMSRSLFGQYLGMDRIAGIHGVSASPGRPSGLSAT